MPFTTSGLEMEQTYSYKPEARMWLRPMEVYDLQLKNSNFTIELCTLGTSLS